MASFKPFPRVNPQHWWRGAYAIAILAFAWACAQFYIPGKGFTYLVMFGDGESGRYIPELRSIDYYELTDSYGYDAQWYAQIAMRPNPADPVLRDALDAPAYRARRILFCWTAYGLAGGDPERALHLFAAQNIVCWLLLAMVLWRWFPPRDANNFVRWCGVMFSLGMCFSVRGALVDGPSLLLIAVGVALAEAGRPWWSAALLGISGLGKETNVLAGAALAELGPEVRRSWRRLPALAGVVALPLAAWLMVLNLWVGSPGDVGQRNFSWPFFAYVQKWRDTLAGWDVPDARAVMPWTLVVLVALTTQWLFFALRWRWHALWWRVGAAYALLMVFLGDAVWEGYPEAASRVLLPMALAFNVLVPRGRRWWVVLLLGNLTLVLAPQTLRAPPDGHEVSGPAELRRSLDPAGVVDVVFDDNWYAPESERPRRWRWSRGPATVTLRNPQAFALEANVKFDLESDAAREVVVRHGGREVWRGALGPKVRVPVEWRGVRLDPGVTVWAFETDTPAATPGTGDARRLAFRLENLEVKLTGRAE